MFLFLLSCLLTNDVTTSDNHAVKKAEINYSSATKKIRDSSVRIVMLDSEEVVGHGSGNYFKHRGRTFIVTAAHVVEGETKKLIQDGNVRVGIRIVFIDFESDIAILVPNKKLSNANPIPWKLSKNADKIGSPTYYTGFPSHYGKILLRGMISSVTEEGITIQSFALPGSSGSVVFDEDGRVIGVVSAVGLHMSPFSPYPSLQEDMVFISKLEYLTSGVIMGVLECGA